MVRSLLDLDGLLATFDRLATAAGATVKVGLAQIGHGANVFVATA
jgi:hypothetical protein